jgi:hypothetical protein
MLYHATADSLAYIGEDSSLDLFFDEFLSVTDPIKIKIKKALFYVNNKLSGSGGKHAPSFKC